MSQNDSLGDRMKFYEERYSPQLFKLLPVLARMDGRSFHTFTNGLFRPFDERLSKLMIEVTKYLVHTTNARCGYTQSDEITLVWQTDDPEGEIFFGGKLQKMISIIGSLTTLRFNQLLPQFLPEKKDESPVFDSRVWEVPVEYEAANTFIWREQDATRNSIQMAGQANFSHAELQGVSCNQIQEKLFQERGINWNDYPSYFKRGTYVRRRVLERKCTVQELSELPPYHHARKNPDLTIKRTMVMEEDIPSLTKLKNREDFILRGAEPILGDN